MELRIVTVGGLKAFVEAPSFEQLPYIPISPLRAISQQQNPNAEADDPALVVAYDENLEVLAYFGCLPDSLRETTSEKVCWSSCWWVHPQKGKAAVMPVFYKGLQLWKGKMLFDALPKRSRIVLEKMGYFSFWKIEGIHAFLRFKLHKIIPARIPFLAPLKNIFYLIDSLINIFLPIKFVFWKRRNPRSVGIRIDQIKHVDETTIQFIQALAGNDLILKGRRSFNWIHQSPWLSSNNSYTDQYHFSSHAKHFENILLNVYQNDELIAFFWLTIRDGTAKLPYCYVLQEKKDIATTALLHQLIQLPIDTFICFQANILDALNKNHPPFLFKKHLTKVFGWTKTLDQYFEKDPYIQDGDGDGVFT